MDEAIAARGGEPLPAIEGHRLSRTRIHGPEMRDQRHPSDPAAGRGSEKVSIVSIADTLAKKPVVAFSDNGKCVAA